jgi:hypothetical protein
VAAVSPDIPGDPREAPVSPVGRLDQWPAESAAVAPS